MSLDVTLKGEPYEHTETCHCCGHTATSMVSDVLFDANITHNLSKMADEAGIYMQVWRPDEIGITKARELIEPLRNGIALMKADPPRFEAFNSPNGWGLYKHFLPWLERYLLACEAWPDANVEISR